MVSGQPCQVVVLLMCETIKRNLILERRQRVKLLWKYQTKIPIKRFSVLRGNTARQSILILQLIPFLRRPQLEAAQQDYHMIW